MRLQLQPARALLRSRRCLLSRVCQAAASSSAATSTMSGGPLGPGPGPGPGLECYGAEHADCINRFKQFVPTLSGSNYKGQHGKVGVVGGCREYTGAPYFAAISSTKVGSDLTYVFSTESAAAVIKGYSPELIVMPLLPELPVFPTPEAEQQLQARVPVAAQRITQWVQRLSCLVVGPGLGDDPLVMATAAEVLRCAREANIPIIVDGSGINIIVKHPQLVQGYRRCILTPNIAELGRLAGAVGVATEGRMGSQWQAHARDIAAAFGGPILVSKGPVDVVTDGSTMLMCSLPATPKRSGGQGDVLTGVAAAFVSWVCRGGAGAAAPEEEGRALAAAAYAACSVMRDASLRAFGRQERAMLAGHVIEDLHTAFKRCLLL